MKFKDTKIGKLLTSPIAKGLITKIPFIGSVAGELLNRNTSDEWSMTKGQLIHHLVKIGIYAVLMYLVFSGNIDFDNAEDIKSFMID